MIDRKCCLAVFGLVLVSTVTTCGAVVLTDTLQGSTTGTRSGGSFVAGGWQVTNQYDAIYWHVPPMNHGAYEFNVTGLAGGTNGCFGSTGKNELSHGYDWTFNNADNQYSPGYQNDPYKSYLRKQCEADRVDTMEILWQILPNFHESDTVALSWSSGTNYLFRVVWENVGGNSTARSYRNGALIMTQTLPGSWNPAGQSVRIASSTRRANEGAPLGAVYSNVKVEDLSSGGVPTAPTITAPGNGSTVNTTIVYVQWSGDSHTMYQMQINSQNAPDTGVVYDSQQVSSTRSFAWTGALSNNATYYVFVRLATASGWGPWSANGRTFTVDTSFVPSGTDFVTVKGNSYANHSGPFLGLGFSYFRALFNCKFQRTRYNDDLSFMAARGYNYQRTLSMVAWDDLEIAPVSFTNCVGQAVAGWSDYLQQFRDHIDIAFTYGIRTEVTIFADAQCVMPSDSTRTTHMNNLLAQMAGREHKVVLIEVANESWQNGFPGSSGDNDVRNKGNYLAGQTAIPVSLSSPSDTSDSGINAFYAGSAADLTMVHFTRDLSENGWRPVRDSYRTGLSGVPPVSSNEPIGPGSSVNTENDPIKLCMAGVFAWTANCTSYVYHSKAGVQGWTGCCPPSGTEAFFSNMAGNDAYQNILPILPKDLSSWERNDGKAADSPFTNYSMGQANKWWTEVGGATNGCVRHIAAIKGGEFVSSAIGILGGGLEIEARRPMSFQVYHPLTGAVAYNLAMNTGEHFTLAQGPQAYVIKGVFTDIIGPTNEVSIDMGSPDVAFGMTNVQNPDGNTSPTTIGGRSCRQNTNPSVNHFFYFGVADSFAYAGNKPALFIVADYYDTGTGNLSLEYDGAGGAYQSGGSVALTNTNTWKQKVWSLSNAHFANRQNAGADFRIGNGGISTMVEPFTYTNGAMNGKVNPGIGTWSGGTVGNIEVLNNMAKLSSSTGSEAATNFFSTLDFSAITAGGDNIIVVKANVQSVIANNGNTWKFMFQNVNGAIVTLMAGWDGQWDGARPRHEGATGGQFGNMGAVGITSDLTGGGLSDEIKAHINISTGQIQYYFNGGLLGTVTHTDIIGKAVNRVVFQRQARPGLDSPGSINFDNISVAPTTAPPSPLTFYLDVVRVTTDQPSAPIIEEVSPDPQPVFPGAAYSKQLVLTQGSPAPVWSVLQGPVGAVVNASGLVSGWTPSSIGDVIFNIQAINSEGSDTESWVVRVLSKFDYDGDSDVDASDFGHLQNCFSGETIPYGAGCADADSDNDGDVAQTDFANFLPCMLGAQVVPGC